MLNVTILVVDYIKVVYMGILLKFGFLEVVFLQPTPPFLGFWVLGFSV